MKEVYLLATEQPEPVSLEVLRPALETDEVVFTPSQEGYGFRLRAQEVELEVSFQAMEGDLDIQDELITGSEESQAALREAKGCYQIAFEPGKPTGSVAVFEALWCARALMEHIPAVLLDLTSLKLHDAHDVAEITELDFDIRDHVNLHAVEATTGETPLWVHSHGMEKFGVRDVEIFHLNEADLLAAESFLHELCTDLAFSQGPSIRSLVETSNGEAFMLVPSEEARVNLMGVSLATFDGHEGLYLSVVSPAGRHNLSRLLRPYRERFDQEPPEKTEQLRSLAQRLLPAFQARFQRKGLMEPLNFMVRSSFDTHPDGEVVPEHLWLEVLAWEERRVVGKLVDGAAHTTEWRKGAQVEVDPVQINAIALEREGRTLEEDEMSQLLMTERPM